MLQSLILATAISVQALSSYAGIAEETANSFEMPTIEFAEPTETPETTDTMEAYDTAAYCEWVTVYDYWGNWVTLWQCY